jgi:S-adenosylmethionine/arginine decarboxylase-like enzyme
VDISVVKPRRGYKKPPADLKPRRDMVRYLLCLDVYTSAKNYLKDIDRLKIFLETLTKKVEMTPISGVDLFPYTDCKQKADWGIAGGIYMAESHIKIHTYPDETEEYGFAMVDICSCKRFDEQVAIEHIKKFLGADYILNAWLLKG